MTLITIEHVAYTGIGFGWLIAVICILRNFCNWTRGRYFCLLSDITKATFATITIALVVYISADIYVDLRNSASENTRLVSDAAARERTIEKLLADGDNFSQMNLQLISDIERLNQEINWLQENRTLVSDLRDFWSGDSRQDNSGDTYIEKVTRILERHFGEFSDVYELEHLKFQIRPTGSTTYVNCNWDDPYLYCGESG